MKLSTDIVTDIRNVLPRNSISAEDYQALVDACVVLCAAGASLEDIITDPKNVCSYVIGICDLDVLAESVYLALLARQLNQSPVNWADYLPQAD